LIIVPTIPPPIAWQQPDRDQTADNSDDDISDEPVAGCCT